MSNDIELLRAFRAKLTHLKDRVRGVATGFETGLYVWGPGGTGKTYVVEKTLRRTGMAFKVTNSCMMAKGLVTLLEEYPDRIHVIDDAEPLLMEKNAQGVLRSALWGQPDEKGRRHRTVIWRTDKERIQFTFKGGVIVLANTNLATIPALQALGTRITVLHYKPTNEEVRVQMYHLARKGFRYGPHRLEPSQCREVVDEVVKTCRKSERPLNLRLLSTGCNDRLLAETGVALTDWRVLLESRVRQCLVEGDVGGGYQRREKRLESEVALVRSMQGLTTGQRLALWQEKTGKSQAVLYRRLEQAKLPN